MPTTTAAWRAVALSAGVALACAGLGACGGATSNGVSTQSASQIYSEASTASSSLRSLHVHGTIGASPRSSLGLDLDDGQGAGGGTVTIDGSPLQVVETAGSLYLRGDATIWRQLSGSAVAASALAGRWLKTASDDAQFAELSDLVDVTTLFANLSHHGTLTKGPTTTFDGHPAIGLHEAAGVSGTIYVATTGRPYLLGIASDGDGTITFDQLGTASLPAAPSGSQSLAAIEAHFGG